ncbi:MAG: cytochrome b/b6 domain-containing protein [Candidatus Eremiobacteraeota bacterium]|nr:cytochrome b/b6 domain-containing protein [Candidatus Eremiobacteraeota bacterium]
MQHEGRAVYRHSVVTRITHWAFFLAFMALVSSGLQVFNAAPYLDASDKSNPARRVLSFDSPRDGIGTTTIFGHTIKTTGLFGWTADGMGGSTARAFPSWLTIPAEQSLADGRRWHFFFAYVMIVCGIAYVIWGLRRKNVREMFLRRSDLPKLWPMQAYYFRLRQEPPEHGTYNPLQKLAYTLVVFVFAPAIVISGIALSPGYDAFLHPITSLFGGRQFARLWHFVAMVALIGFFVTHIILVATQGVVNQLRSMITGWFRLDAHDGTGV